MHNKNIYLQELYDKQQNEFKLYMNRYSDKNGQIKCLNDEIINKNKDLQIKNREIDQINNRVNNFV